MQMMKNFVTELFFQIYWKKMYIYWIELHTVVHLRRFSGLPVFSKSFFLTRGSFCTGPHLQKQIFLSVFQFLFDRHHRKSIETVVSDRTCRMTGIEGQCIDMTLDLRLAWLKKNLQCMYISYAAYIIHTIFDNLMQSYFFEGPRCEDLRIIIQDNILPGKLFTIYTLHFQWYQKTY